MRLDEFGKPSRIRNTMNDHEKRFIDELVRRLKRKKVSISVKGPMNNIVDWGKGRASVGRDGSIEYHAKDSPMVRYGSAEEFMDSFMQSDYNDL